MQYNLIEFLPIGHANKLILLQSSLMNNVNKIKKIKSRKKQQKTNTSNKNDNI